MLLHPDARVTVADELGKFIMPSAALIVVEGLAARVHDEQGAAQGSPRPASTTYRRLPMRPSERAGFRAARVSW